MQSLILAIPLQLAAIVLHQTRFSRFLLLPVVLLCLVAASEVGRWFAGRGSSRIVAAWLAPVVLIAGVMAGFVTSPQTGVRPSIGASHLPAGIHLELVPDDVMAETAGVIRVLETRLAAAGYGDARVALAEGRILVDVATDPADTESMLLRAAGDKYTYRELDDFTDLIQRTLQGIPQVSKVTRSGVLQETIYLNYSQERLAA